MRGPRAAIAALRPTPGEPNALGQRTHSRGAALSIGLCAAIVAASVHEPRVLTIRVPSGRGAADAAEALPSGPLEAEHRTLEIGLRTWVERQTGQRLGYVEQLYTFGDRDRHGRWGRRCGARAPRPGRRLSGAGARGGLGRCRHGRRRPGRCRMARLVSLFPVGGLAPGQARAARTARGAARGLGGSSRGRPRAAAARGAPRARVRPARRVMERGTRPRTL